MVSALAEIIFLCSSVKLHRRHAAKALLVPLGIIKMDIFFDGGSQCLLARKFSQIVHLGFQNSPESFHRTIVNTPSSFARKCLLVYWNPRSLWNRGCALGWFLPYFSHQTPPSNSFTFFRSSISISLSRSCASSIRTCA